MSRTFYIGLSIAITAFIATNFILMFGEKSILAKRVYVHEYEQVYTDTYKKELAKEALVAPNGEITIYSPEPGAIDRWLVRPGDVVTAGAELAVLNELEAEEQREIWEAQEEALEDELSEVQSSLRDLESASTQRGSSGSRNSDSESMTSTGSGNTPEVNVDVTVEVPVEVSQEGAFAAGIAQAEQKLAEIERELAVVQAQLEQTGANPALLSPVDGYVASIQGDDEPLSITLYASDKIVRTYLVEEEWKDVEENDQVTIYADGMEQALPATVSRVSEIPAETDRWLEAYRALYPEEQKNGLAFYEVEMTAEQPLGQVPFGATANAVITTEEAADAVALYDSWIFNRQQESGAVHTLTADGHGAPTPVTIAFDLRNKTVLSEGLAPGAVVLKDEDLRDFTAPVVFMPFPTNPPSWYQAKNINWREYVNYLFAR